MSSIENKRIASNTIILYLRLILTIVVNLYSVRIIWEVLGVDNYGIYNVVGGIVMMFAFLNTAMIASSQRYISFELGTGNIERLRNVFCISMSIHFLLAIAILILGETVGLWFLNYRLNIPLERMNAANWVYQLSILTFIITVISVPYSASVVAHEHMKTFGYFGIIDVLLKLGLVYLLPIIPFDKLIVYAFLILLETLIIRILYKFYCNKNFEECHYRYIKDPHLMREMFSFAGWSFIGNLGFSVRDQGLNILINIVFNVAVNAAKGIASQIGSVVLGFAQSFQMAVNPQITKRYAKGDYQSMIDLVFNGVKFCGILILFIVVPFFFACEQVLIIWLGDIAPYTVGFVRLTLVMMLVESMVGPITTAIQATGRIKWFQILISIIMVSSIPIALFLIKIDKNPYIVLLVTIGTSLIAFITRLILLRREFYFSILTLVKMICARIFPILLLSAVFAYEIYKIFEHNITGLILYSICTSIFIGILTIAIGLDTKERVFLKNIIKEKINVIK